MIAIYGLPSILAQDKEQALADNYKRINRVAGDGLPAIWTI